MTRSDFVYLISRLSFFGPNASPSMVEHVVGLVLGSPVEVWTDGIAALIEMDLREAIARVTCPALVVVGDLDRLTPPASALALKNALPQARLVVLKGAGHMAPMERHEQFNELLTGFVDEVFTGARARIASGGGH
jgi:3-oxoadipate enol-lactonase